MPLTWQNFKVVRLYTQFYFLAGIFFSEGLSRQGGLNEAISGIRMASLGS